MRYYGSADSILQARAAMLRAEGQETARAINQLTWLMEDARGAVEDRRAEPGVRGEQPRPGAA